MLWNIAIPMTLFVCNEVEVTFSRCLPHAVLTGSIDYHVTFSHCLPHAVLTPSIDYHVTFSRCLQR
jgi:hypothetical protein